MPGSCLNFIACGGRDSLNDDELLESSQQSKSVKRVWSFGKRSARHRVLSNTVVSETPPSLTKDTSDVDFQTQPDSTIPDKTIVEEKPKPELPISPIPVNSNLSEPNEKKADANVDESVVITIQSAIRGDLAQNLLLKHKNVIKLQAAVRGHLVRKHAVGTFHCIRAIIKMQALVRSRILDKKNDSVSTMNKQPVVTYTSMENLLRNSFARQLLKTTSRNRSMNIKCDPLKSDSAWKWLERWMLVEKKIDRIPSQDETVDLNSSMEVSESDDMFDIQAYGSSSPSMNPNLSVSELENINGKTEEILSDSTEQEKSDIPSESVKEIETEGKKIPFGSKKGSNPVFLAVQSKFEILSSSVNSTNQDMEVESKNVVTKNNGSECGTELSISSTLDSPDRSDTGTQHPQNNKEKSEVETKVESVTVTDTVIISELEIKDETEKEKEKVNEGSPKSQVTVPKLQETPASEISVNHKRTRSEKSVSNQKLKSSSSAGKRSPSSTVSTAKRSIVQIPKDNKTVKRRNSLGLTKPDQVDQEQPRDSSSSSNTLPSYMQPTESAKAKALLLHTSPKSSPDLQEKEIYIKKRHSLPGVSARQSSPHIQRTMSQNQQSVKGDSTQSPQERKWLR